jgi:glycosyltransferase involved in cell wall biosynthesis
MKVLQLSTYPIVRPRHGGQIRTSQIRLKLQSIGHEVLSLSVSERGHQQYDREHDLVIEASDYPSPFELPFCSDLLTARLSETDDRIFEFLQQYARAFRPDMVMLEQPWLWPAVRRMLRDGTLPAATPVVYSSQNIESHTKASVLRNYVDKSNAIERAVEEIAALECDLVKNASNVVCVTRTDAGHFQPQAPTEILLCPNGVTRRKLSSSALNDVTSFTQDRPYVLFTGSAYPPNAEGFWEMMGPSLAYVPPNCMVVIVGGVGEIIHTFAPKESALFSHVNGAVIQSTGQVTEETLTALIYRSSGIILPITSGGGSNLKTAEAIASNKPVVATSPACRGYDFVAELGNFYIADDQIQFSKTVTRLLDQTIPIHESNSEEQKLRDSVHWEYALANFENLAAFLR